MEQLFRRFVFAALVYLIVGSILGFILVINPITTFLPEGTMQALETGHFYLLVFGFLGFMVFGASYHIIPKYAERELHNFNLANIQFWLANVGLIGLVIFYIAADVWGALLFEADADARAIAAAVKPFQLLSIVFGAILTISVVVFARVIMKTLNLENKNYMHKKGG